MKAEWKATAGIMTFDEAVKTETTSEKYDSYIEEVSGKIVSLQERRAIAKRVIGQEIQFDWELPRLKTGQYWWQWCTKAVIDRSILAAPLGDVSWSRQGT